MRKSTAFSRGVLTGVLAMIGASAAHWLITPMQHPDASIMQQLLTVVQLLIGFGGALWLAVRERNYGTAEAAQP